MITRFKIFENNVINKYWKVRINDDLLKYRLKKIGMKNKEIYKWISSFGPLGVMFDRKEHFVFIGYDNDEKDWSYTTERYEIDFEDDVNYKYYGEIDDLTFKEIDKYKKQIEIEKDVDKFNL